jgi:serine/threonine protein kinase
MKPDSARWKPFGTTSFPWEAEALTFLRERLGDVDPNRVWCLFEFVSGAGTISEVDALVLTSKGFYLVEIKSRPGVVTGDAGTWTWKGANGQKKTDDNPLILANRKAKRLVDLLRSQRAMREYSLPYLQPVVFLSATDVDVQLDPSGRHHVYTRDLDARDGKPARPGIVAALTHVAPDEVGKQRRPIDTPLANAIGRAIEQAGIRESRRMRRFGSYELDKVLAEGPGYQDWLARHPKLEKVQRRIRIYSVAADTAPETRQMLQRAAKREFSVLQDLKHDGILQAHEYHEEDRGPGIVFAHDEHFRRLDHFLRDQGDQLSLYDRLQILRDIGDTIRFAHEKKLIHRALSPSSILIRAKDEGFETRVFNWQTAAKEPASTTHAASGTFTVHLKELVEDLATLYLAPEVLRDTSTRTEGVDVFSLGCIAFMLFANRPPAEDALQLRERLQREKGLLLSSNVDGAIPDLVDLIRDSTNPDPGLRFASASEFLRHLDAVEEVLTRPAAQRHENPVEAVAGEVFEGGYKIKARLGKGSSAIVFLVEKDKSELVLKLALDLDKNATLQSEAKVLGALRHSAIVRIHGQIEVGGHLGLLLDKAGNQTLGDRIRKEGAIQLEHLHRFGDDLLSAVQYLEDQGQFHRDIKPDNIGVTPVGRGDSLHLVLFDFSLAGTSANQVQVGTRAYLDPFLGDRDRRTYDQAAERYAAAVTLYEMATGVLPRWGDGRTDPATTDVELALEVEALDPSLRDELGGFFHKALQRDFRKRFDTTEEMRREWNRILGNAALATSPPTPAENLTLTTPLRLIGMSNRAVNALERDGIDTVRQLLELPLNRITHGKGIGNKTREELVLRVAELRQRFPEVQPQREAVTKGKASAQSASPAVAPDDVEEPATIEPLAHLVDRLVPQPRGKAKADQIEPLVLRALLGIPTDKGPKLDSNWPSQSDIARATPYTNVQISLLVAKARERWRKLGGLTRIRLDLAEAIRCHAGIVSLDEATALVAAQFSDGLREPMRTDCSRQALRAATEAESAKSDPAFEVCRRKDHVWLVTELRTGEATIEPAALVRFAMDLGERASKLAESDPLPGPARVLEALEQVRRPKGMAPLGSERLVRLAAAAGGVAVSSRLELYPIGMPASRALRLAQASLLGVDKLTTPQIRERIEGRYPQAEALPADHGRLASLLREVVPDLHWDPVLEAWTFHLQATSSFQGEVTMIGRLSTQSQLHAEPAEVAAARAFDERLQRAIGEGQYLVLAVGKQGQETVRAELVARYPLEVVSCEALVLQRLRAEAQRLNIAWTKVLQADAAPPGSTDWTNLQTVVRQAAKGLADAIGGAGRTVLLTHLGILARYGLLDVLERLRERTQLRPEQPHALHGVLVLVATEGLQEQPVLDGQPIPVLSRAAWSDVPEAWIQNVHRGKSA